MPLSLDDLLVQPIAEGSFTTTPGTVSLASGTTAGSTVLIAVASAASSWSSTGFTNDVGSAIGATRVMLLRKDNVGAGENAWSLTGSNFLTKWAVLEVVEGALDPVAPLDVEIPTTGQATTTSGTSVTPGTTAQSTSYDALELAIFGSTRQANITPNTFSGYTGGYSELYQGSADDGTKSVALAIAARTSQQLGQKTVTATAAVTLTSGDPASSYLAVYSAQGAKREANIAHFWAFKVGAAAAGLGTGSAGFRYFETMTGSPAITADGLQLASTSAAESVASATISFQPAPAVNAHVLQAKFRFDGSLPSVNTDLVATVGGTNQLVLRYVTASQKLGFKISTGSEVLSDATVAADTWYTVDLRIISVSGAQTGDWQIDYGSGSVAQTQASFAGAASSGQVRLGWADAITVPGVTFAHLLVSTVAGHYPLGTYTFVLLGPDPAATPTVSGTVGNFALITSNATGATLTTPTLGNARDAVDEFPPTVGASADGVCAIAASATDYIEFPLETYPGSGVASIRAARVVLPMWAASGTVATCRVLGYDGTTATTLHSEADPEADNSSTPAWICRMWRPSGGWTQAKLDAAAIRFGSNDATPDIGPHAVGMEVAIQMAPIITLFGGPTDPLRVEQALDPVTQGIVGLICYTPVGQGATLVYELDGVEQTPVVLPADTSGDLIAIDAPDMPTVSRITLTPAEPA